MTAGAFGPFVCPEGTEQIALRLRPIQVTEFSGDGRALSPHPTDLLAGVPLVTGTATLDLRHPSARWSQDHGEGQA